MMQRKLNLLLLLFSLIGGAIGFALGELLLHERSHDWPGIVVIGLYFGILAFCIGLFCLLAEMISPRLNGASWRQRYVGTSWKWLIPATFVLLLVAGLLFELIYELNLGGSKPVKDIVLAIDNSGSMKETDPDNDRYAAAKQLIGRMDSGKRVAIVTFNHKASVLQPFTKLNNRQAKDEVTAVIDGLQSTDGGTDIGLALSESMKLIRDSGSKDRGTMVILLSDGFSDLNKREALADYKSGDVIVNTIGLSLVEQQGSSLLRDIADETGGRYYDVTKANDLSFAFNQIYDRIDDRMLVTERTGPMRDSAFYFALRIVLVSLLGAAIGLALGLVFDNRYLARSFGIGGAVAGLAAGFILEVGLSGRPFSDGVCRLFADLVLAGVIALFTLAVPIKDHGYIQADRHRPGLSGRAGGFAERQRDGRSKGF